MILNFIKECIQRDLTSEDWDKDNQLINKENEIFSKYQKQYGEEFDHFIKSHYGLGETTLEEGWKEEYFNEIDAVRLERLNLHISFSDKYKEAHTPEEILEDVRHIAEAYTKEDFLKYVARAKNAIEQNKYKLDNEQGELEKGILKILKEYATESYKNCFSHFYTYTDLSEAVDLLEGSYQSEAVEIIKDRIALWYEKPKGALKKIGSLSFLNDEEPDSLQPPKYDFIYPTDFQQNLTKASSTIFNSKNSLEELKQIAIDVSPKDKKLTTTYSVNVDLTAPELKGTENITEYDKSVHNMTISMAKANAHGCFTPKQVATALYYGDNPNNSRPSPQQIGAVTKSIEKQRHIDITIDWTEHIKLNNKDTLPDEVMSYQRKGYMLPVEEHIFTVNGTTLNGYQFIKEPPLYQYATSVGQIGQHPIKMLNVPINLDQTKIVIRDFLLEEIAHIKGNTSWNRTIGVDRLLEVAGEDSQTITRKKKSVLLSAVKDMLGYWKKEGYIVGYKENLEAKSIRSFTIEV